MTTYTAQQAANNALEALDLLFTPINTNGIIEAHVVTGFVALRLQYVLEALGEEWATDAANVEIDYNFITSGIYENDLDVMKADWGVIGPIQTYLKQDISDHKKAFFLTQMLHLIVEATATEANSKFESRGEDRWEQMASVCNRIQDGVAESLAPIFETFNQAA